MFSVSEEFKKTNDLDVLISHKVELPAGVYESKDKTSSDEVDKDAR